MNFQVGDIVECRVDYYSGVAEGQCRTVLEVIGELIKLRNQRSPYETSNYHAHNFRFIARPRQKKEEPMPAYEKTKYFASQLADTEELMFVQGNRTPIRNYKSEVIEDVKEKIQRGERYMILKTEALIEFGEPKPPIKITEYK